MNHQRRGMTLVEVLAVVVILGLIAGVTMVGFSGAFRESRHGIAKAQIGVIAGKLETYMIKHARHPSTAEGLRALTDSDPSASYYLNADAILDPWNREYQYISPGSGGHPFEIVSFGEDGQQGGDGPSADISSTNLGGSRE